MPQLADLGLQCLRLPPPAPLAPAGWRTDCLASAELDPLADRAEGATRIPCGGVRTLSGETSGAEAGDGHGSDLLGLWRRRVAPAGGPGELYGHERLGEQHDVRRQFNKGAEAVVLEKVIVLPDVPTMGTRIDLRGEGARRR